MECRLSVGQEALLFLHHMAPESAAYNVSCAVRVHSPLDVATLARAATMMAQRHDLLRSTFAETGGQLCRVVGDPGLFEIEIRDVPGIDDGALLALVRQEVARPFRLAESGAARLVLLRRGPSDAALVPVAHHVAMDFPSLMLVLRELLDAYPAVLSGDSPRWAPITSTYADFVARERALLDSPRAGELANYWREVCRDLPPVLNLPTDRARPARQGFRGWAHRFTLPADLVARLTSAARSSEVTPARYLFAVFQSLLYRYTRQPDFLVGGAVVSSFGLLRRGVPGHYTNTVPLRARFTPATTFREVAGEVNRQVADGLAHRDYPFAMLPAALGLPGGPATSPLLRVMTSVVATRRSNPLLELAVGNAEMTYRGTRLSAIDVPQQAGQFDLTLEVVRSASAVRCSLKYDTDLFDERTVCGMAGHFVRLLRVATAAPDRGVADVSMVDETERKRLLAFATGS